MIPQAAADEIEALQCRGSCVEIFDENQQCYVWAKGLDIPAPPWSAAATDILIPIPASYENAELDKLLLEARSILDDAKRKELYAKAQQIVRNEAPMIFGWGWHQLWGVSTAVKWSPDADEIDKFYTAKPA